MSASRPPLAVLAVAGVFIAAISYLVLVSLTPRRVATFPPSPPRDDAPPNPAGDTVTIDARAQRLWRFFDVERGSIVEPPDTAGWDLAFRRHHIISARGIADLGTRPLDSVTVVPQTGYVPNRVRADTTNPAIDRWYSYNFLSHLLEPARHAYATPLGEGSYAVFTIVSYYCPGPEGGCVTIRYVSRRTPP